MDTSHKYLEVGANVQRREVRGSYVQKVIIEAI